MPDEIFFSGPGSKTTQDRLSESLSSVSASSLFFASAYVTQSGINRIEDLLEEHQITTCVAVFGLDGAVTQPVAIESAQKLGWSLRLIEGKNHPFHPKLALAGGPPSEPFSDAYWGYMGSANITKGGLYSNIEAGLLTQDQTLIEDLQDIAQEIWALAEEPNRVDLEEYSDRYAEAARARPANYQPVGAGASVVSEVDSDDDSGPPEVPTYNSKHATVAWTGLESFTGEYTFQVEFPRIAGEVIRSLVGSDDAEINVMCSGGTRSMKYSFYEDNGMFRLNIPNEVPGAKQARREKSGLAVVRKHDQPGIPIELEIINDRAAVADFIQRSKREGSWGETQTRLYGWL